ncbi:MAG: spore coat polysaccharide biosynthesis protein SpsF [Planctomycetota bacterium]|jgi:spore coat polysaccharide biosynthesis protein SpsF
MRRERAVAFVVARLGSQRLREKQLRPIGDRRMLDWIVDNLQECQELDEIVLTTLQGYENDRLAEFATQRDIECYRYPGPVENVTNRLRCAAEEYDADICVLVSADCPLIYAPGIDRLVTELRGAENADVTSHCDPPEGQAPLMQGIAVARRRCWQFADDISDRPELRANQFPVVREREELFTVHNFEPPEYFFGPKLRLSVDTWADLEFMTAVHDQLADEGLDFQMPNVVDLVARNPELIEINAHVRQRVPDDELKSALFIVDAGAEFGYEGLQRSLGFALQLVERASCPVTFMLDDLEAKRQVESKGLRVEWGALGRTPQMAPHDLPSEFPQHAAAEHDLVVVDLGHERELPAGWRARFEQRVAVLGGDSSWATEADEVGESAQDLLETLLNESADQTSERFGRAS